MAEEREGDMRGRKRRDRRIEYGLEGWIFYYFAPFCWSPCCSSVPRVEIYWCGREIGFCGPCSPGEMCGCATWAVDYGYGTVFVYLPQTWSQFTASFPGARIWFRVMNADELVFLWPALASACVRHLKSVLPVHPCCETGDLPRPLSMFVISEMIREVSYPLRKSLKWSLGPGMRPQILLKHTEYLKNRDEERVQIWVRVVLCRKYRS